MKHALRKYLSPCGSALFMVVSTMAALIVLVTAMYMSVLSSRQVQYATFDQEQAYVTSTSMADAVFAMFKNPGDVTGMSDFVNKITDTSKFQVGDYVTATESDLGISSGGLMDSYNITITRMSDEVINTTTWYVYDIVVTVDNNGIMETTHTFVRTKDEAPPKLNKFNKFFTATGYLPNDVVLNSGSYENPLYFDAEYVKVAGLSDVGRDGLTMNCPLTCAGSLSLDAAKASPVDPDEPTDWVIGNNMDIVSRPYQFYLGGGLKTGETMVESEDRGRLFVGGNFTSTKLDNALIIGQDNKPTDLYVLGDCTIGEGGQSGTTFHGNLYIGGNLIIASHKEKFMIDGNIYLNGTIICDDADRSTANFKGTDGTALNITWSGDKWVSESTGRLHKWSEESKVPGLSVSDALDHIKTSIGASVYPKWVVKKDKLDVVDIAFCNDYVGNLMTDQYNGFSDALKSAIRKAGYADSLFECKFLETISEDCTIRYIYDYGIHSQETQYTIVIDTGKAGETRTINLMANRDTDGDGVDDTFSWLPIVHTATLVDYSLEWKDDDLASYKSNKYVNILTVGEGNLVINIDDRPVMVQQSGKWIENGSRTSVIYKSTDQEFFGHYGWFIYYGGQYVENVQNGKPNCRRGGGFIGGSAITNARARIHYADDCKDSCTYSDTGNVDKDGNKIFKCDIHDTLVVGEVPLAEGSTDTAKKYQCQCDGRIVKSDFTGSNYCYPGDIDGSKKYASVEQKPNVNIFLVSCLESAQIILANPNLMSNAMNNVFCGFVYAPYMTYIDTSSGGGLKSIGGLIVSDYIMSGDYSYVFAQPDQSITEIAGDSITMDGHVTPAGNRDWRVNGV